MAELRARRRPSNWIVFPATFAAYFALAVVITFPLIRHLSSRVPMDLEDSLWYVTVLWWNAHVAPLTAAWWNGFAFYPSPGMMAFSDHMLGASLVASPLQWLGAGPITAYNLTFLASFALSALAAHALAFVLTRRHDAALVCGLAYGFNPYRVGHLAHLELLMAFGMPLALAAAHKYLDSRRTGWLVAFGTALALQAILASYYALFFGVLLAMWMLWFIRPREWRHALALATAGAAAVIALLPIVLGFSRVHESHNLSRDFAEVLAYSADVTSLVTAASMSALWGWTALLNGGERQLFPGLTVIAIAAAGAAAAWRRRRSTRRDIVAAVSTTCWALAAWFLGVAAVAGLAGPWRLEYEWLRVSVTEFYKPLSLALACAMAALATSTSMRTAFERRSVLAFYVLAAAALFLCSLGPRPEFLGQQILYEAPYAWLMRLPFFADGGTHVPTVRVPARFGMLVALALSAAAALAFARLTASTRGRRALLIAVAAGIIADGWIRELPLLDPGRDLPQASQDEAAALMMLPLGDPRTDTAAMYWATLSRTPTVNGYHSYAPLSYQLLKLALADRDPTALDALASLGPLVIAADTRGGERSWASFVADYPGAVFLRREKHWTLFRLPRRARVSRACGANSVVVAGPPIGRAGKTRLVDAGDALTIDAGRTGQLCGVMLSLGADAGSYPRSLRVSTSLHGTGFETGFAGRLGGAAFLAALEDPVDPRIVLPVQHGTGMARFIRLEMERAQPDYPWTAVNIAVRMSAEPRHVALKADGS